MATDSPDSSRKHPHSPSEDESQDRSKRHKHRHHHSHRHRSHHRHGHHRRGEGSRDRGEERKGEAEAANGDQNGGGVEEVRETARPGKTQADYDMEEGEIVEDADLTAGGADFGAKMEVSESESGEIRAVGASSRVDDSDTRRDNDGIFGLNYDKSPGENNQEHIGELDSPGNGRGNENNANGDAGYPPDEADRGDSMMHERSSTPVKARDKHKVLSGAGVGEAASLNRRSKSSQLPSDARYHDESLRRNRSKSPNNLRRKSHSQATFAEEDTRRGHGHVYHDNGGADYVPDDDRTSLLGRESRTHRERRHAAGDEKHHNDRDSWDRQSGEKYKDRKMEKERKMKHRDHGEERQLQEGDRKRETSRMREFKKERELDKKGERLRERSRDIIRNGEYEEDRYKEKDYRRSKERDLERERQRESSRSSHRDRDWEREKDRERYSDRSRDVQERSRDSGSDRHRDKVRDAERDRFSRHYGRDDEDRYRGYGRSYDPKHHVYDGEDHRRDKKRIYDLEKDRSSRDDSFKHSENKVNSDEADQDDYLDNMELELLEQEEEDINKIKEESRKRREAILQKYRTQELQQKVQLRSDTDGQALDKEISGESSGVLVAAHALQRSASNEDQAFLLGKSPPQNEASMAEKTTGAGALGQGTPKSERSNDVFGEDIFGDSPAGVPKTSERPNDMFSDDIFVDSPAGVCKTGKGDGLLVDRGGLHDNWDDPEGYYGYRLGEILDGRYEIAAAHGKGVFSTVVRAKDLKAGSADPEEVAIKIIRNNDTMLKAGMDELIILKKLVGADPDDRRHCVRYISSFKYRNHLCLVFESLNMNLREVLKKFGRNIGLKLTAVRAYAKQLFIALKHLKNCGVLHCDIKPDNMLVNDAKNVLKLCDFGNAMFAGKNEVTPYLVSRFYRAPEIILGLSYDHPLDIWSVGCCLYELSTGKVLFPGATNNDMLRLHMELKGPFPKKMLRKGAFTHQHFDQDLNFHSIEEDLVSKKTVRRLIVNIKPKDISTIIKGSPGEDPKMLANFKDLLDKIFVLDPDKRLTVSQALNHPFITGK